MIRTANKQILITAAYIHVSTACKIDEAVGRRNYIPRFTVITIPRFTVITYPTRAAEKLPAPRRAWRGGSDGRLFFSDREQNLHTAPQ